MGLLRLAMPVDFTLFGISVAPVRAGRRLK